MFREAKHYSRIVFLSAGALFFIHILIAQITTISAFTLTLSSTLIFFSFAHRVCTSGRKNISRKTRQFLIHNETTPYVVYHFKSFPNLYFLKNVLFLEVVLRPWTLCSEYFIFDIRSDSSFIWNVTHFVLSIHWVNVLHIPLKPDFSTPQFYYWNCKQQNNCGRH